MKYLLIPVFLFFGFVTFSSAQKEIVASADIINGDTIPVINLKPIYVFDEMGETGKERYREYLRLVRNVKKVMPYAQAFSHKMEEINAKLETMDSKRERKRYLKETEKQLKAQFEKRLKNLTWSQGELLLKLIDRETGKSSYDLIKMYKSGFSATFWNTFAGVFGMSLKQEYSKEEEEALEKVIHALGYE